jgi:hypothetical protein
MQAVMPCATVAAGATPSHWFIEPHSSDSTWPNEIQRRRSSGMIRRTASEIGWNRPRGPVWNRSGSSASIRY